METEKQIATPLRLIFGLIKTIQAPSPDYWLWHSLTYCPSLTFELYGWYWSWEPKTNFNHSLTFKSDIHLGIATPNIQMLLQTDKLLAAPWWTLSKVAAKLSPPSPLPFDSDHHW